MDWSDLRIFLAFVRNGTVRSAANVLGTSHSTVARRLERIELDVGHSLFERLEGSATLTQIGEDLLHVALRIEEEMLGFERRSFARKTALEGPLKITLLDALAVPEVLAIFAKFSEDHPSVDLHLDFSFETLDLDRREADLALRFGREPAGHLVGKRLSETARAVYASREYIEIDPDQFRWIGYTVLGEAQDWKDKTPFPNAPTLFRVPDMRAQKDACLKGLGLAFLPCFLCENDDRLVRLNEPDYPEFQWLWVLRHKEAQANAAANAIVSHLSDSFKTLQPLLKGGIKDTLQLRR